MKKKLNQKLIDLIDYYSLFNANLLLNNIPLKRVNKNSSIVLEGSKIQKLDNLKKKIKI